MSGPPMARSIERVVVPLDATSENLVAIETAARLAAHAKAPIIGIFVEDEDLLQLAGLPFARQVTVGAEAEKLTTEHVELHLRLAAERARRELFAAAKRHGATASFDIVRGASASALVGTSEGDIVVAGALTRPIAGHFRVECRWWSSIGVMPGPFLLARHAWNGRGSVALLLRDRGAASLRLLDAAAQIAEAADALLTVLHPPASTADAFRNWVSDRLAGRPIRLQVEIAPAELSALRQRLGELECRLLAIEAGDDPLRDLVERYACDILIVR
jgi:nucleotide-binding universal stress UspA family protein